MKKRGASGKAVITLIVLIALVLIAILWFVIFPIFGGSHQRNIDLSIVTANDFTVYDPDTKLASVEIARGDDNEALIGFDIVFDVNGKKIDYKVNSEKVLSPGTSKVYKFDLADYTEPDSVSIYPIFEGSGFFGSGGYTGNVVFIIAEATLGKTGIDEPVISQVSPPGKRLSTGSGITGNVVGACGSFSTTAPCPAGQIRCSADGLCKQITCIKSNCFVTCGSGCPVHIPTDFNDPNYCPIGMDSCVNDGTGCTYPCSGSVVVPVVADWNTRNACTSDARCEGGPGSCISGVCGGPINIPDLPCGGADFNGDGIVNGTDIAIFNSHVGMANPTMNDGDLNGDGAVISGSSSNLNSDWRIMMHTLGMTCTPRSVTNPGGGGCAILDAKLCPDGSYVGRVPPSCAFATCPVINGVIEEGTDITDSGVTIPLDLGVVITSGDILSATIECVLNSAEWSTNQSSIGSSVGLSMSAGPGCEGVSTNFTISRSLSLGFKTTVAKIFSVKIVNGSASASWNIESGYRPGAFYVFDAEVGSLSVSSNNSLYVSNVQSSFSVRQTSLGSMDYALTGSNIPVTWTYVGAGDFNGDGKKDIYAKSDGEAWRVAISNLSAGYM